MEQWYHNNGDLPKLRIFGYSQGGVLGQRAIVDLLKFVDCNPKNSSIFFNPVGVESDYIDKWKNAGNTSLPTVYNYVVSNDIISQNRGRVYWASI